MKVKGAYATVCVCVMARGRGVTSHQGVSCVYVRCEGLFFPHPAFVAVALRNAPPSFFFSFFG